MTVMRTTMRAARLIKGRTTLQVQDLPIPSPRPNAVVVRVGAALMPSYLNALIDGSGGFETPPRPFTPGQDAVGTIHALGSGVTHLAPGQRVFADSYLETPDGTRAFQGCFPIDAAGGAILADWPDGSFAEFIEVPTASITPVPANLHLPDTVLCNLGWLGTAFAGLQRGGLQPGGRVAVIGATGLLGTLTVLSALAMGASQVFAIGRSADRLAAVEGVPRVVLSAGPPGPDAKAELAIVAAEGDVAPLLEQVLADLPRGGRMVLLASPVNPPKMPAMILRELSVHGSLWFPRDLPQRMMDLMAAGVLDVGQITPHAFTLADVDQALQASRQTAPFQQVVITP